MKTSRGHREVKTLYLRVAKRDNKAALIKVYDAFLKP
jgi:hypothetical protein